MYRGMDGKTAIITGAASGIGRATAVAFARNGVRVAVADVDDAGGGETVRRVRDAGGEAIYLHADVSRAGDVEEMITRAVDSFGRLDFAFNNAGIEGTAGRTADCTEENWARVLAINLTGAWLCMKHEIPHMLAGGGGVIVNCASVAGVVGFAGSPAYTASKHGLVGLSRSAALEYATEGIRVNVVCPGVIRTPMVERYTGGEEEREAQLVLNQPIGRVGQPEEIASAVLWLCSDEASFVIGHPLMVDGGWVAR